MKTAPAHDSARVGVSGAGGAIMRGTSAEYTPPASNSPVTSSLAAPLIARLEGVIAAGPGRWYSRCPAHADRNPSLSVRDTGERILLHCHAGCDPDDVLAAVGLKWRDIYPDPWECAAKRPNEAAARYFRKALAHADPLDLERMILWIAAADRRAGEKHSIEDRARIEVALDRLAAAKEVHRAG